MGEKRQQAVPPAAGDAAAGPREIEVKFEAGAAAIAAVLGAAPLRGVTIGPAADLVSTYFDTAAGDLQRAGIALRVRRKGRGLPVLALKWPGAAPGGVFGRGEIEVRCRDGVPRPELFAPAVSQRLAERLGGRPLMPVLETRFRRRTAVLREGRSAIELAIDEGAIIAGAQRLPLSEIELELKSGSLTDLLACAASLARSCGLSLAFEPKSARGLRLRDGVAASPVKALPLALPAAAGFDAVVIAVLSNTLAHFVANWAALRQSDAPEAVHQMRVALRRMRSALAVFGRVIERPELRSLRAEARRIAAALGPARACDAFRQNALAGPLHQGPEQVSGAPELLAAVEAHRQLGYRAARALIEDPATSLFVLDVQSFLADPGWHGACAAGAHPYAAGVLAALHARALKRGKGLAEMPDAQRHELRIALKNLRYAGEFFGSLFGRRKDLRGFLRRVAGLQEDLGAHNDAATAAAFVAALALPPGSPGHFAAGYVLGWYRHATTAAATRLAAAWKDFKRADTFWA